MIYNEYIIKGSLVWKLPSYGRLSWAAFQSSRLDRGSGRQKSGRDYSDSSILHKNVKQLSRSEHFWKMRSAKGARDCRESSISHKNRKSWGARSTFGRWGRQNVHETVARAQSHIKWHETVAKVRFHMSTTSSSCSWSHKIVTKMRGAEPFWKMRPTKCARDCTESSVSHFC